jgi:hypothetical protein
MFPVGQTDRATSGERLLEWFKRWAFELVVTAVACAVVVGGVIGLVVALG